MLSTIIISATADPMNKLTSPPAEKKDDHAQFISIAKLIAVFLLIVGIDRVKSNSAFDFLLFAGICILLMIIFVWHTTQRELRMHQDFSESERNLNRALDLRDEFLSIASHELKTPLTSLSLQAQITKFNLLKNESNLLKKDKLLEFLTMMDSQVLKMAGLVEDMVDISRIDCGRFFPVFGKTDLSLIVHDVLDQLQPQLKAANCEVIINRPENIIGIWDAYRIEQLLMNLITNAFKYGSNKPIHITILKKDDIAIIEVRDHGIGIAKENQQRIFNRFERAVSAKGITGLGLGLYIVKKILDLHRGSISVNSQLGAGSKFTVELPLVPITALTNFSPKDESNDTSLKQVCLSS